MANRRGFTLFNALLLPAMPGLWLYTQWRRFAQRKSLASVRGMWGHVPSEVRRTLRQKRADGAPILWLHAVSVGEVMAARIVSRAIKNAVPHAAIALSTTTDTGHQTAQAAWQSGEIDAVFYYPIDAPVAVRRALNVIRPQVFATMETELWPNFLSLARARGVKCFLLNGRVSDRLLRDAPRLAPLWRWMLPNFSALLMRSELDTERMRHLIGQAHINAPPFVQTVGDVKLDQVPPNHDVAAERAHWRQELGIASDALLWIAGSTHTGEDLKVLSAFQKLRDEFPTLRLIIAPRHIERRDEVLSLARACGLATVARSTKAMTEDAIIVLDTVGELSNLYAASDVAFVGGSLIERGGHNLLEPVLRGVPVLWGPHVANFRAVAALVEAARCGQQVADEAELLAAVRDWLRDEEVRREVPSRAAAALQEHRGAAARVARILAQSLSEHHSELEFHQ